MALGGSSKSAVCRFTSGRGLPKPDAVIGFGWNLLDSIVRSGDGYGDIVARRQADGSLWLNPGIGDGRIGTSQRIGFRLGAFDPIF